MKGRLQAEIGRGQDVSGWKEVTTRNPSDFVPDKAARHTLVLPQGTDLKVGDVIPSQNARQIIIGNL